MSKSRADRRTQRPQERSQPSVPAAPPRRSPLWGAAIVLLGGAAIGGAVALEFARDERPKTPVRTTNPLPVPVISGTPAVKTTYIPQPPGEAPPGRVWSPTCGHWHDALTGQPVQ
ncbi:MAG: hypothetical protein JNK02_09600 [Planctomycetes bacterium]|nr:hypothetical protein [Planctomycetota bacterium]